MADADEDDTQNLCATCVGNVRFAKWIRDNGVKGKCDFDTTHGRSSAVVSVKQFAEEVDRYFRETYQQGEELPHVYEDSDKVWYEAQGEPYKDILANDLECDEGIVEALAEALPDCDHYEGDEAFYDDSTNYEYIAAAEERSRSDQEDYWYENRFSLQWTDFCQTVQFERRFFKTKELLDSLFGHLDEYQSGPIRPVYELQSGANIFRARMLDDEFNEERLDKNPDTELGAPPKERTRAGRLNVEYIPAFYGAFSEETAVAEMRPSIGDKIAVGEFTTQQTIKVFDFTVFSKVADDKRKEALAHTRYDFITQMEDEISKPIRPFEKQREYIATQIVAEYLREYFSCDAMIYRSSMRKNGQADDRNIVIFYRGIEFVGQNRTLKLVKRRVVNVMDVAYSIFEDFFSSHFSS